MKWMFLVFAGTVLLSCKKEKSESGCQMNIDNLSGNYRLTKLMYTANPATPPANYLDYMEDCEKDDIITLKSNGTYEYFDKGKVCTDNSHDNGSWKLEGNNIISDGKIHGRISSFDCHTLVYYIENSLTSGDKFEFTMEKQ